MHEFDCDCDECQDDVSVIEYLFIAFAAAIIVIMLASAGSEMGKLSFWFPVPEQKCGK